MTSSLFACTSSLQPHNFPGARTRDTTPGTGNHAACFSLQERCDTAGQHIQRSAIMTLIEPVHMLSQTAESGLSLRSSLLQVHQDSSGAHCLLLMHMHHTKP